MTISVHTKRILTSLMVTALAVFSEGCRHLDTDRIPPAPVRLSFTTLNEWDIYGTPGAMNHKRYIKSERIPANFPYTALSQTGFGGLLLVGDIFGAPRAYDLACPVECRSDVRIVVDEETGKARCPKCHSVYDIFTNYGQPLEGPALRDGYGLRQYYVGAGNQGEYMVVTN
ncbi:MAG: hypothetical protein K2G40_03950 [Muribaculaceae bacterium]|nr:hypothetical protein [Muribaculaceae bacterium]